MNVYEVTYKNSPKARKLHKAIRFGKTAEQAANVEGEIVVKVELIGERGGEFCAA